MIYENKLSPKQIDCLGDFNDPDISELYYYGGARSTKTSFIVRMILERALIFPGSNHLISRYRKTHLKKNLYLQTFLPMIKACVPRSSYHPNEVEMVYKFNNGSIILFEGLDDKERTQEIIMGSEFATAFINEAIKVSFGTYQDVKSRLSQYIFDLKPLMIVDGQPRKRNWTYEYFILGIDPVTKKPHGI